MSRLFEGSRTRRHVNTWTAGYMDPLQFRLNLLRFPFVSYQSSNATGVFVSGSKAGIFLVELLEGETWNVGMDSFIW